MSQEASWMTAFWSFIVQVLTWGLVVLGWLVVVDQTEYRELTKIALARIAALRDQLRSIEELAIKFHTSPYDQASSRELTRKIKKFSEEMMDLKAASHVSHASASCSIDVRKAVTLENFDQSSHQVLDRRAELVTNIEAVADRTDTQLMRCASSASAKPRTLRMTFQGLLKRI